MTSPDHDQDLAKMRDTIPALWWAMYAGCLDKGFTKEQAMTLVQTFIMTTFSRRETEDGQ